MLVLLAAINLTSGRRIARCRRLICGHELWGSRHAAQADFRHAALAKVAADIAMPVAVLIQILKPDNHDAISSSQPEAAHQMGSHHSPPAFLYHHRLVATMRPR